MNISLIIGSMRGGGAQRVVANLANYFQTNHQNISIITIAPEFNYKVNSAINWRSVYKQSELKTNILNKIKRRIVYPIKFYRTVRDSNPDIIISFLVGLNKESLMISKILKKPIILTEHTNYKADRTFANMIERRFIYKYADAITVLTKYDFVNYYSRFLSNVHIMPNPLSFEPIKNSIKKNKVILAVGGLDRWKIKGFDTLITAYSKVATNYPEWELQIAGSGEKGEKYLKSLANELGVLKYIKFLGFRKDIDKVMKYSSIYVMSSRYEGFSMGLIEAMSQRCAPISFDCIAGPSEIINDDESGILVENQNITELCNSLIMLIDNEDMRNKMSVSAMKRSRDFCIQKIGKLWLELIEDVCERKH